MASLEEKYKKENLQNHIYNTPDTYVGGCESICEVLSIYDPDKNKIVTKEVEYIPAILNIYNEILVNAKDQVTRLNGLHSKDKSVNLVTEIKVEINKEKGEISIMNNGDGIDVANILKKRKMVNRFIFLNLSLVNYLHLQITIKKNKKWLVVRMGMVLS